MKNNNNYFITHDEVIVPITNNGNNNLFVLSANKDKYLLKKFTVDQFQRIEREVEFYNYLKKNNISNTSELIDFSFKSNYLILSFLQNGKNNHLTINEDLISQYAHFINVINSFNDLDNYKLKANDSFFSVSSYKKLIEKKINTYKNNISDYGIELQNNIIRLDELYKKIIKNIDKHSFSFSHKFLSPSDVGFHNSILIKNSLFFVDFEYAGLDNPFKMVSDFILQPRYLISKIQAKEFLNDLSFVDNEFKQKLDIIFPLFVIKWILIFYNFLDPRNKIKYKDYDQIKLINKRLLNSKRYFQILKDGYEIY